MTVEVDASSTSQTIVREVFADFVIEADGVQYVLRGQGIQAQLLAA